LSSVLRLVTMTDVQFAVYGAWTCENYARTSPNFRDRPFDESFKEVKDSFANRLPEGPRTPGAFLLAVLITDEDTEKQIGYLDIAENPRGSNTVYIFNIGLYESAQGKGFGKQTLARAEEYLKERGYTKIGLNVFADNEPAKKLYADAGYAPTQFNMEKKI
jgi:RimJ/RimL family protein N-acetyltransferase